ncbi:LysR substrate-binding domain-containing protein [Cupriavidus basilensis]
MLAAFQRQCPDIRLHILATTDRRVDLVEDGIDVALRVGTIAHETMVARRVLSYRHVLVAKSGLVERLGMPETPESFASAFPARYGTRARMLQPSGAWRLRPNIAPRRYCPQ